MINFVNLLCQYVTVSLSVLVYKLQSVIYIYIYVVVTAAAGAEADRCMWAHCASEVL